MSFSDKDSGTNKCNVTRYVTHACCSSDSVSRKTKVEIPRTVSWVTVRMEPSEFFARHKYVPLSDA